jgi:hypothetical protein
VKSFGRRGTVLNSNLRPLWQMERSDPGKLPSDWTTKLHLQLVDVNAASGPAGVLYSGTEAMRSTETCRRYAETSNYGLTASTAMKSPSFTTRVDHSLGRHERSYYFKRHFRRTQQCDLYVSRTSQLGKINKILLPA